MAYPFRRPIIIDEIRWTLQYSAHGSRNTGALVYTKMTLGNNYLMRDPVPIWLLGTLMDLNQEQIGNLGSLFATNTTYAHYRWRLPEPLYVDAGEVLRSTFSRTLDGFNSITVQVTYVGRTVAPGSPRPGVVAVPYAAPFITDLGNTYQQSNEKHLFNPFNKPIRVQRLTGRVQSFVSGTTSSNVEVITPPAASFSNFMTLQIEDSWGGKIVSKNTGVSDIVDVPRAAWTFDTVMPPKGMYLVQAWNIQAAQILHMAMVGVREEPL